MKLETARLSLRPFVLTDASDVLEYLKEPTVNCFQSMKLNSLEDAQKEMQKRAGEIDAYPESGEPHTDSPKDTFSLCWMLNQAYQGKGFAFEAANAFFNYLFSQKGARRIYAYTEDYNTASQNLCKKLGMRFEGLFKEFVSFFKNADGSPRYENTMQWAILKSEWETLRK